MTTSPTSDVAENTGNLPLRKLLLFGVLLPAAVVASDMLVLSIQPTNQIFVWVYAWIVTSIAVVSFAAGRYLQPLWLAWIVYAWSLSLLDLLTIAARLTGPESAEFGYTLISAQMGVLVFWGLLGPIQWQWRLPCAIAAAAAVILFSYSFTLNRHVRAWNFFMIVATLFSFAICGALRWFGFSLQAPAQQISADFETELKPGQFGVKHMLAWSTALVPMLLAARGLDILLWARNVEQAAFIPAVVVAITANVFLLLSTWAVLGTWMWPIRVVALVGIAIVATRALSTYSHWLTPATGGLWTGRASHDLIIRMDSKWTSWLSLYIGLLVALLLFFKARGYRLCREDRTQPLAKFAAEKTHS